MTATGGESGAAIGGGNAGAGGNITISGGTVAATGGSEAPGIGGGTSESAGEIKISGGTVTATGGSSAAGIGGGYKATGGTVKISGGTVTATGGSSAAGIGSGQEATGAVDVTISGGETTAEGDFYAAGIGGGYKSPVGTIRIENGVVTAISDRYGAGIGGGRRHPEGGSIYISGGFVTATCDRHGPGIGSGDDSEKLSLIKISGGIVHARADWGGAGIGSGRDSKGCGRIEITGGTIFPSLGPESESYQSAAVGNGDEAPVDEVVFSGGAIYAAKNMVDPAATNQFDYAVFPVDFGIGIPTNKAVSIDLKLLGYIGYIWVNQYKSFSEYGATDLYTDENGVLRLWLPSTAPNVFTGTITMEDGSVHYFVFQIGEDGTVAQSDYLVVNGEYVTDRTDATGTGWSYTTNNCLLTLTGDVIVKGISTNGGHRLLVSRGGASSVTFQGLDLRARGDKYASTASAPPPTLRTREPSPCRAARRRLASARAAPAT